MGGGIKISATTNSYRLLYTIIMFILCHKSWLSCLPFLAFLGSSEYNTLSFKYFIASEITSLNNFIYIFPYLYLCVYILKFVKSKILSLPWLGTRQTMKKVEKHLPTIVM